MNYIPVSCKNAGLFQYAVSFDPRVDSLEKRKRLFYMLKDKLGNQRIFDGVELGLPFKLTDTVSSCHRLTRYSTYT